jgi:hypothetical protein
MGRKRLQHFPEQCWSRFPQSGTRDSENVDGVERFFIAMAVAGALGFVATLSWMLIFH